MSNEPKYLVHSHALPETEALHIRHPLNPHSDITMYRLSDRTGMERIGVSLARVPPGKESFIPHMHRLQEEWVYILEGRGHALIGEQEVPISAGDFLGFPTDGTVHHLKNTGDADLVFLQGGERRGFDIGHFPTLGKMVVPMDDGTVRLIPEDASETLPMTAWLVDDEPTIADDE